MKALKTILFMALAMIFLSVSISAITLNNVALTANEGTAISSELEAATNIIGTATYALTGLPAGATFNTATRRFTWTPDYNDAVNSPYTMTYTVIDDMGTPANPLDDLTDSTDFVLIVSDFQPLSITQDVLLGGSNQYRSNPEADDLDRKAVYTERQFTITNNGDLDITCVTLTALKDTAYSYTYDISFTNAPNGITLAADQSVTVTIKGYVPKNLPSFFPTRADSEDRRNLLGTLTLASTNADVANVVSNFYMEAENNLQFDRLYVYVGSENEKITSNDEKIKDIKPNDEVEIQVRVENKYDNGDNANLDIEDIEFTAVINDNDLDVDEDIDFGDLGAEEVSDDETITFLINPADVEEGTYVLTLTLFGEDENGAKMGLKYKVDLEVEQDSHEVIVTDLELTPETAVCKTSASLEFTLLNIGNKNEEEIAFKVEAPELNLYKSGYDIELDSRDDETKTVLIPLNDVKTGDYDIEITTYYDRNELTDSKTAVLHVEGCNPVVEEEVVVVEPDTGLEDITGRTPAVTVIPELESFDTIQDTTGYMVLLGGLVIVLTIVLILLLIKFVF